MNFDRLSRCLLLAALAVPAAVRAQGFGLNEIGSCAVSRGFAVTSVPCNNPSEIYWNPSATTGLQGLGLYVGAAAVQVNGGFNADSTGRQLPGDVPVKVSSAHFPELHTARIEVGGGHRLVCAVRPRLAVEARLSRPLRVAVRIAVQRLHPAELRVSVRTRMVDRRRTCVRLFERRAASGDRSLDGARTRWRRRDLRAARHPDGNAVRHRRPQGKRDGVGLQRRRARKDRRRLAGRRALSLEDQVQVQRCGCAFTQQNTNLVLAGSNPFGLPAGTPLDALLSPEFAAGAPLSAGQHVNTEIDHPAQFQAGLGYTGFTNTTITVDYAWIDYKLVRQARRELHRPGCRSRA